MTFFIREESIYQGIADGITYNGRFYQVANSPIADFRCGTTFLPASDFSLEFVRLLPDRSWLAFDWLIEDNQLFLCGVRVPPGVGSAMELLRQSLDPANGRILASWFSGTIRAMSYEQRDPGRWRGFDFDIADGYVVDSVEVEGVRGRESRIDSIIRNIR